MVNSTYKLCNSLSHFCILFSNYILWYYNCNMVLTLYLIYLSFKQWFKTWFARTIYKVLENNWILLKTCYVKEGYPYCRDFCQNQLSHFGTFLLHFIPNISHKKTLTKETLSRATFKKNWDKRSRYSIFIMYTVKYNIFLRAFLHLYSCCYF